MPYIYGSSGADIVAEQGGRYDYGGGANIPLRPDARFSADPVLPDGMFSYDYGGGANIPLRPGTTTPQAPQVPQRYQAPQVPNYNPYQSNAQQGTQNLYAGMAGVVEDRNREAKNASVRQQQAQDYTRQLADRQSQLQDKANKQIEARQKTSESMFAGMMNQYQDDPMFSQLRGAVTDWMNNPGLSQSVMRRMRAQSSARAAADLAGSNRQIDRSASRSGLRGAQVDDARWSASSRSNAALGNNLLNLDLSNEKMKQQGRAQAIGAGGSLMNNYYGNLRGMGGQYSNLLTSYNPQVAPLNVYDAMQQVYSNPNYGGSNSQSNPYAMLTGGQGPSQGPSQYFQPNAQGQAQLPSPNGPAGPSSGGGGSSPGWGYASGPNGTFSIPDQYGGEFSMGLPSSPPPGNNMAAQDMYQRSLMGY